MTDIIYDARRIKLHESLMQLGEIAQLSPEWCDELWENLVFDQELLDEFIFYLNHHYLDEKVKCRSYSLIDLYVWQLNRYNLIGDVGKNTSACNKERMVLKAFRDMISLRKNPEEFIKKMTDGRGMDK